MIYKSKNYIEDVEKKDFNLSFRDFIIPKLPNLKEKICVDLACGSGFYSEYFNKNGALKVYSVDGNRDYVDHTIKRAKSYGIVQDLNDDFKLKDLSTDFILAENLVHYLNKLEHFFKECRRIMKKNGELVIFTHNPCVCFLNHKNEQLNNYFDRKIVKETWNNGFSKAIDVEFYHKPLEDIINISLNFLKLKSFKEFKLSNSSRFIELKKYLNNNIPLFLYLSFIKE